MTKPMISLLLPTRGRPELVERFLLSVAKTTFHLAKVEVILYIDEDDVDSHYLDSEVIRITKIIGPQASMGDYNSACYKSAQGNIIILVNDDMVITTPGWDEKIIELDANNPEKIYLAYANDLFKKRNLCTFPILSRRVCEILVDPYPKEYQGAFIDYHLFDIFKRLQAAGFDRINYMEDVVFEHLHYRTGKAPFDETYGRRGRFADDPTFLALIKSRKNAAGRLLRVLRGDKPVALYTPEGSRIEKIPETLIKAILELTRKLLCDRNLPLSWRSYLWVWFIGRYMASHGMLGFTDVAKK
jgi:glycosyltransferase involved in cell wall biosynthesis